MKIFQENTWYLNTTIPWGVLTFFKSKICIFLHRFHSLKSHFGQKKCMICVGWILSLFWCVYREHTPVQSMFNWNANTLLNLNLDTVQQARVKLCQRVIIMKSIHLSAVMQIRCKGVLNGESILSKTPQRYLCWVCICDSSVQFMFYTLPAWSVFPREPHILVWELFD